MCSSLVAWTPGRKKRRKGGLSEEGARTGDGGEREQGMDGSNDNGWMGARAGWMDGSEGRGG